MKTPEQRADCALAYPINERRRAVAAEIRAAVEEERAACCALAAGECHAGHATPWDAAHKIAKRIRTRTDHGGTSPHPPPSCESQGAGSEHVSVGSCRRPDERCDSAREGSSAVASAAGEPALTEARVREIVAREIDKLFGKREPVSVEAMAKTMRNARLKNTTISWESECERYRSEWIETARATLAFLGLEAKP